MSQQNQTRRQSDDAPDKTIPVSEWAVALVGVLLVVGVFVFLISDAAAGEKTPPSIVVEVTDITSVADGFLARLIVRNTGGETAAALSVEGTLTDGETVIETSDLVLDYVPGNSERRAGMFFSEDPAQYALDVRALGYQEP